MWNKLIYISIFSFLAFTTCKKQNIEYDKEKELPKDTLTFISDYNYSLFPLNPGQATVNISFTTFNQLQSKQDYSKDTVNINDTNYGYTFNITNDVVQSKTKLNSYSTMLLFEKGEDNWYKDQHNVGFYLRRYLENTQNNVAMGYYETSYSNNQIQLFNKDGGSEFNNKWEDNLTEFYNTTSEYNAYNLSFAEIVDKLDQAITIYSNSYAALPNKSITLFLPSYYNYQTADTTIANNLINRAISEGVELNFIAQSGNNKIQELAYKTGGFYITNTFELFNQNNWHTGRVTYVDMAVENLELLLLKDYTYHQITFDIIDPNQNAFLPNNISTFNAFYNKFNFTYVIKT